jgi:hypothetical protein
MDSLTLEIELSPEIVELRVYSLPEAIIFVVLPIYVVAF